MMRLHQLFWKSERRLRIISSNVKIIVQQRPTTPVASTVKQFLYSKFVGNAATRYGLEDKLFEVFRVATKGEGLCCCKGQYQEWTGCVRHPSLVSCHTKWMGG